MCDCGSCLFFNFKDEEASQVFEFIEIPSYVALISDDSSEPVYFVKVEAKGICEEIMTDTYGHTLNSGEKYFRGKYLQKVQSRKSNKKQFQLISRDVFVTPDEVFDAFIGSDDELAINNNQYLHLIEQSRI